MISEAKLKKLEESVQTSRRNGKALYMLQKSAKTKRQYTKPKKYALEAGVIAELSQREQQPWSVIEMHN